MNRIGLHTASVFALAIGCALGALPAAAQTDTRTQTSSAGALEEVIVTAQRREQNLQTTPVSVTAFTAAMLETRQITQSVDLQNYVPNLYLNAGVNNKSTLAVSLRGLSEPAGGFATTESPVGFYVDDVFQGRLSGTNTQFSDIERIEVLRGPQGTLFGRNAQAGAVNIITRVPDDELYANASLGFGRFERLLGRAAIGGRLADTPLYASVAVTGQNQGKGVKQNIALDKRVDKDEWTGIRAKLRYKSDLVDGVVTVQHTNSDGGYEPVAVSPNGDQNPLTGDPYVTQAPFESVGKTKITGVNGRLTFDLGQVQLKSVTAWQEQTDRFRWDLLGGLRRPGNTFIPGLDRNSRTDQEQWSQELQLTGGALDERLNWVVGGFYYAENVQQRIDDVLNIPAFFLFNFRPLPTVYSANTESWAGFASGTYALTDRFSLTAGLRYTKEDKRLNGAKAPPGLLAFRNETSYKAWTPRFVLEYKASDTAYFYASASRGFRAGGYNAGAGDSFGIATPYGPEFVWSYEIGSKLDLWENRVRLNTTAFYATYKDLQGIISGPGLLSFITQNAYDADVYGLETELEAVLTDGVTLSVTLGLQDQKLKNIDPRSQFATSVPRPDRSPFFFNYSGAIGLNVDRRLADFGIDAPGSFLFGADLSFRDVTTEAPLQRVTKNTPQRRVNALIGYKTEDERWRVTLSGRNLTDAVDYVSGIDLAGTWGQNTRRPLEPLTWMFEISYRY
jgi:iron complex outermembrane receptor protein